MRKSARLGSFRRRRAGMRLEHKKFRISGILSKLGIIFLVLLVAFVFIRLNTRYWNGSDKVGFAFRFENGDIGITISDPTLSELTTLIIPGDTEVDVARNYGTFRIKNVWQLSQNEKLGGSLLPETLMQNFLFPLKLWMGDAGGNLAGGGVAGIIKFIFEPGPTNIPLGDRISLVFFAARVQSLGKTEINLGESQFLHKEKLNDGEMGYRLSGTPSERLTVYFADSEIMELSPKVYILDATGSPETTDKVGQIIEVIGGKVVSIDKKAVEESDCEILGVNKKMAAKFASYFGCRVGGTKTNFDIEFHLGTKFAKRF